MTRRAWAEIDTSVLAANMQVVKRATNAHILAMVKANGYGHGAIEVAKVFLQNGADALGIACADEAAQLRAGGIKVPILNVGYTPPEDLELAIANDTMLAVSSYADALLIDAAAKAQHKTAVVHIQADTGMCRLGFPAWEVGAADEARKVMALDHVSVQGLFTHIACADSEDPSASLAQFALYQKFATELEKDGTVIPCKHVCNSASIFRFPQMHLDMVRPGICLYGDDPLGRDNPELREAMTVKATVARVIDVQPGMKIGYGATYEAQKPMRVATVLVGYGDGMTRALSNRGSVILRGHVLPIVGRICMDQMMVDVTGTDVAVGDVATVRGACGDVTVTTRETAAQLGTISYELFCGWGQRIPRIYV